MSLHIEDVLGDCVPTDESRQVDIGYYLSRCINAVSAGGRVLDLGCGAGELVAHIEREYPQVACFGVDIQDSPEVRARVSGNRNLLTFDGVALPFESESIDLVVSRQVLEHVRSPALLFRDVARVLVKGGKFCGSTSQLEPFHSFSTWNYTPFGLRLLAEEAGLRVVEFRPGVDAITLIARRLVRRRGRFDMWIASESPLNRLIEVGGRMRGWNAQHRNAVKLQLAGQFCFLFEKPA